jgi:hypothetical protein
VVDLSSGEEDAFPDSSQHEQIARKLFGELKRGLLGPLGIDNMIILSNSDEEEVEVHEDDHVDVDVAPSSVANSPVWHHRP